MPRLLRRSCNPAISWTAWPSSLVSWRRKWHEGSMGGSVLEFIVLALGGQWLLFRTARQRWKAAKHRRRARKVATTAGSGSLPVRELHSLHVREGRSPECQNRQDGAGS